MLEDQTPLAEANRRTGSGTVSMQELFVLAYPGNWLRDRQFLDKGCTLLHGFYRNLQVGIDCVIVAEDSV